MATIHDGSTCVCMQVCMLLHKVDEVVAFRSFLLSIQYQNSFATAFSARKKLQEKTKDNEDRRTKRNISIFWGLFVAVKCSIAKSYAAYITIVVLGSRAACISNDFGA